MQLLTEWDTKEIIVAKNVPYLTATNVVLFSVVVVLVRYIGS